MGIVERLRTEAPSYVLIGDAAVEIERLRDVLKMWVTFWEEDIDDVWLAEKAMEATRQLLTKASN
jgi:hypothetical protein